MSERLLLLAEGVIERGVSILAEIHDEASNAVKAAVDAAYEAGRVEGRREAMAELQTQLQSHIGHFWQGISEGNVTPEPSILGGIVVENSARAAPGSVKPTVQRMLLDAQDGLTPVQIAHRAGFKYNSVRGTLWALGKEGFAETRDGRWYATPSRAALKFRPEEPEHPFAEEQM